MGIRVRRFPEHHVDLHVFSGVVTTEDARRHIERLDANDRWLCYFDPTADLSGVDLAHLPELRRLMAVKEQRRGADRILPTVIVNASESADHDLRFWRSYASAEGENPHDTIMCSSLEAACDWLGLPPAAHDALAAEIGEPAHAPRPGRPSDRTESLAGHRA